MRLPVDETVMMQAEACCDTAIKTLMHNNKTVTPERADALLCEITDILCEKGYTAAKQYAVSVTA